MTRALPFAAVGLGRVMIMALPFCAMAKPGVFGNFDANLALWPALCLIPMLMMGRPFWDTFLSSGSEGRALRILAICFGLTAVLTLLNGVRFSTQGLEAYGTDPWAKSQRTAIVPLLLAAIVGVGVTLGRCLPRATLDHALRVGFALTVGYVALQALSAIWPNAVYAHIWPLLEGARAGSESYVSRFARLSGPTMEAAELAKLMLVMWLPWVIWPLQARARVWKVGLVLLIAGATLSLIGLALVLMVLGWMGVSGWAGPRLRRVAVGLLIGAGLVALGVLWSDDPGPIWARLIQRLTALGQDPSAQIRLSYNSAALRLITEHPWIGLGWSNEVFFFPQRISNVAHLWEVQTDLSTGNALTAKSLWLRLAMYMGLPVLMVFVLGVAGAARTPRLRMALGLFAVAGAVDGGILTSLYLWVGPALCLGVQMRREGAG